MPDNFIQNALADNQLVHAACAGDAAAFGKLVNRHWNMVFALALGSIPNAAEAEDIAQDSFLKAWAKLPTLRDPCRFAGWLARITQQQCTDRARRNARRKAAPFLPMPHPELLAAPPACRPNPGLNPSQTELVRSIVRQLPDKLRQLIILRFVSGLSAVQIAAQLGKRPGAVRVALHRACHILRKDLTPLFEEIGS